LNAAQRQIANMKREAPHEFDRWLEADTLDALTLQRPLADDALRIVAKGEKEDGVVGSLAM
jgi:hypothetical protein